MICGATVGRVYRLSVDAALSFITIIAPFVHLALLLAPGFQSSSLQVLLRDCFQRDIVKAHRFRLTPVNRLKREPRFVVDYA